MKPSGVLAVLLSASIPSGSFAQNFSSARAGIAAESAASGAAGTIRLPPTGLGALTTLSAPSIIPGGAAFTAPTPALSLAPLTLSGTIRNAPSAAQPVAAIPVLPAALAPIKPAAAAQTLKISAAVPRALAPTSSSGAKDEKPGAQPWTEKLAAMFDGGKKAADETSVDPATLKAYVVLHGQPMTEISLTEAASHGGQLRLLTAKNDPSGLTEKHATQVGALVRGGETNAVQKEALAVDWAPKAAAAEQPAETKAPASLGSKLLWPFREAKFLAKTFVASLVKPLSSEIVGGLATKTFPLVTSIGVYWATVGPAHPIALTGLIALSVAQEVFHGFFLKSWNNFQEGLRRARGFNYQMFFNLAYMQGFGTLYRLMSWTANPKNVTPPWSVHYWQDMAVMSVVGTFFGVLGYNSLNTLYAKGAIKRWQHSGIQQLRDLCFLLAAPFFASGSMTVFWAIFLFQQTLDLAIAIWAGRAQARPVIFVTSAAVAASAEFKAKYPVEGAVVEPPLKQALKAVVDNPLVRLMTWPARALWKLVRGDKK